MTVPIRATYRVQLHAGFTFDDAAAIVPYLARLGISHLYASPVLQAEAGSTHGYDVIDHASVNLELGGEEGFARLTDALRAAGMGLVLDIVPNHMAITGPQNAWWWDVLENGPSSAYASYFDVEWDPPARRLRNVVLLPVLGDHYGKVLARGELCLAWDGAWFTVRHGDSTYPLAPPSLAPLLTRAAQHAGSDELATAARALRQLPGSWETGAEQVERRQVDKRALRQSIAELAAEASVADAIVAEVRRTNADPDALDALLEAQNYRLAFWRASSRDLGYRRFFDINTLIGLRVEEADVFGATHGRILEWVRDGVLDGLRIDHPDGLRDPKGYFGRLRAGAPEAWIVAEKILETNEELRSDWAVDGTTGYDFLRQVQLLFVDPAGEAAMDALHAAWNGPTDWSELVHDTKRQVLEQALGSDLARLAALLLEICEQDRRYRDFTRHELSEALRAFIVEMPVYRTYVRAWADEADDEDRAVVATALAGVRERHPEIASELLGFLARICTLQERSELNDQLAMRIQQLTPAVMAKGVEDTAFYRHVRLVALNEVGGDPSRFGGTVADFHAFALEQQRDWPRGMLASSTHDAKRGEDVRARIVLLSEIPDRWDPAVASWSRAAARHGRPDRPTEYLAWQTLVGAWPIDADRAWAYLVKAVREAKLHTSWTSPDEAYEGGLERWVRGLLADPEVTRPLAAFVAELEPAARATSLAQTLLRCTAPGIPDTYAGTELWSHSLVDPDNRRPVDYDERRAVLGRAGTISARDAWTDADHGLPKLFLIRHALGLRARLPEAFDADYHPLESDGTLADRVVAFARGDAVVSVVPRLLVSVLRDGWGDTRLLLPNGRWRNVLDGREHAGDVALTELLMDFPVALLEHLA